jgi:cytochrome c peroxidase
MAAVAQDALKESASGAPENHLSPLKAVIEKTTRLAAEATKSSPNALVTANQIKAQCAACHTGQGTGAASGHLWTDIANYNWEVVHTACNKPGRNPFLCKNMHGLASSYNFLVTGFEAQRENYDALSLSATEMLRISEALEATGVFHGNGDLIGALKNDVKAVLTVAHRRDPNAFEKSRNLGQACVSCHSGPYGR